MIQISGFQMSVSILLGYAKCSKGYTIFWVSL